MQIRRLQRGKEPKYKIIKNLSLIQAEKFVANNGIPIYLLPLQDQEVVKIDITVKAGDYQAQSNLIPLSTLAMLQEGSVSLNAEQIAEKLDFLGAYLFSNSNQDYVTISVCCIEKHLPEVVNVVSDFLFAPTFPEDKLATHILKRQEQYKIDIERVEVLSQKIFRQALFGQNHPYGAACEMDDFSKIKRQDLVDFYEKYYVAEGCKIIICGNPKSQEIKNLIAYLKENKIRTSNNYPKTPIFPIEGDTQLRHHIEKENAVQSSINIGKVTINRTHPDFIPLRILNTILGGYFGSRLMTNVREEKGYTYGIGSGVVSLRNSGYFIITSSVGKDVVPQALDAIYYEIKRLRTELVPESELSMVKTYIQSSLVRNFDGAFATSGMLEKALEYDIDYIDYYHKYWKIINKIQSKDLQELANTYLNEDSMYEIVVG
jgi:predicted Zn-dependent peptidase